MRKKRVIPEVEQVKTPPIKGTKTSHTLMIAIGIALIYLTLFNYKSFLYQPEQPQEQPSEQIVVPSQLPTQLPSKIPTVDPDPLVDCLYPASCGGSKTVKKSECDTTTCCRLKAETKIMRATDCNAAIRKEVDDSYDEFNKRISAPLPTTATYTYPSSTPYPTFSPLPTSVPRPTDKVAVNDPVLYQECMDKATAEYNKRIDEYYKNVGSPMPEWMVEQTEAIKKDRELSCQIWYKR